jgi:hypothetical protein
VRCGQLEPYSAIDLGKGLQLSTFRRPFDFERVALEGINVEIAFDGESGHALAPTLTDVAQRFKRCRDSDTCLFQKFAAGSDLTFSPSPISPFGIDQAPSSFLRQ